MLGQRDNESVGQRSTHFLSKQRCSHFRDSHRAAPCNSTGQGDGAETGRGQRKITLLGRGFWHPAVRCVACALGLYNFFPVPFPILALALLLSSLWCNALAHET